MWPSPMSDLLHINFTPINSQSNTQLLFTPTRLVAVVGEQLKQIYSERSPKIPFLPITPSQAAALIKAKHHIRKFRIKRKSPPAASNLVLLRKIPNGQDQKLKQTWPKTMGRIIAENKIKKNQEHSSKADTHLSLSEEEYLRELRGWGEE